MFHSVWPQRPVVVDGRQIVVPVRRIVVAADRRLGQGVFVPVLDPQFALLLSDNRWLLLKT